MYLEMTPKKELAYGTMGTDGRRLFYDPEGAAAEWTDEELEFAVAHEVGHCAFGHLWRRGNRDAGKWNVATDHPINLLLTTEGFTRPKGALFDRRWEGWAEESIYAHLPDMPGSGGGGPRGKTLDDPDTWEKATSGEGDPSEDEGDDQDGGSGEDPQVSEEEWKRRVVEAAETAKSQGKLPGHLQELIENLVNPKLDWKALLREYVVQAARNDYRWTPPNKRWLWVPMILPGISGEHLECVVGLDTSGSISTEEARAFLSELQGIADQFTTWTIHVMYCDAAVHDYRVLSSDEDADVPLEFPGRGGTDFRPVFDKIDDEGLRPPVLVYMTDGYGTFPKAPPEYPVLWLMTSEVEPPFGMRLPFEMEVPT